MPIPTEPIGSIPRPPELIEAVRQVASGRIPPDTVRPMYEQAIRDTIQRFEATGSPVITDGEQSKPSFVSYPIHGRQALGKTRPYEPVARGLRRPQQPCVGTVHSRGEDADWCPHLPRRRQRLNS